jgi:hypothetical protein
MRRAIYVILFFMLTAEQQETWGGAWMTPFRLAYATFIDALNITRVAGGILLGISILLFARYRRPKFVATPMVKALWWSIGGAATILVWGTIRGGDIHEGVFQIYWVVGSNLIALALIKLFDSPAEFIGLGKTIAAAAIWRAFRCAAYYMTVMRSATGDNVPDCCTTHHDTVLFDVAIVGILVYAFEIRARKSVKLALWSVPLIMLAIQWNMRRLAWVSLVGALATLYFVYPPSTVKAQLKRVMWRVVPILAVYLIAGKVAIESNNKLPIFRPLESLLSATDSTNLSTKSRDAENMGLLVTYMQSPWLGVGFGHEYIEVDAMLSARGFAQYRYVPHNSALGFFAFAGILGFASVWMVFPISIFLNTRTCRTTQDPRARAAAVAGVATTVICISQAYGDMGMFSPTMLLISAVSNAAAARLSAVSGAWPAPSISTARKPRQTRAAP